MNEQETIVDIIAEMRALSNPISDGIIAINGRIIADRLEAAHKRELSKNASKNGADFGQLGDCTKLRKALEAIISGYKNADLCDMNYGEWCHDPANVCVNVPLCKAIHEARAALAAPPRNCDLTKVTEDPWRAWLDDKSNWDEFGSPKLEIHDWLLAPATEKEGGAK